MAVQNSLTSQRQKKVGLTAYLTRDAVKAQIGRVVGGKNGDRFITSIISAVQATPALQECTNNSILSAALVGEALKLSPSPQLGHFYMVPFDNRKLGCKEAQFILGYKGYLQLAIRSGMYKKINVVAIKQGELIRYDPLDEEIEVQMIEDEEIREKTPTIGYYAVYEYLNGFKKALYWSKKKMESHAMKYSKGYAAKKGYTFWEKDFDAMALKTMLRQLISKYGIMSIELQKAYESDMAVIRDDGTPDYVETEIIDQPADEEPQQDVTPKEEPKQQQVDAQTALFGL